MAQATSRQPHRRRWFDRVRTWGEKVEGRLLFAAAPTLPTIAAGVFRVTSYGTLANGSTDDTSAIQAAINAGPAAGGGTVEVAAGAQPYETGPLTMRSSIDLQVEGGATLQMVPYGTYPLAPG